MKRMMITAGGTGGHIFPALAVARALREQGVEVHWLGARGGLEEKLVPSEFPIDYLSIKGFRRKNGFQKLLLPFRLLWAIGQAYRFIRKIKPDVLLGMGGYVAGPAGVAAWLAHVPLIIHEQNAIAGLTNRILAKMAKSVLQAFQGTFAQKGNVITTGNPVRKELVGTPLPETRLENRLGPLRVLVLGGSQGARPINDTMLVAMADYPEKNDVVIWHQTGPLDFERVKHAYEKIAIEAKVSPFIDDMVSAYCWADLLVCRAGALTVSEVAAVGVATLFIPYPYAVDNHQFHNSRYLEQAGAALILIQKSLTKDRLIELVRQFAHDRNRLLTMAICARQLSQPSAVEHVIAECAKISVNGKTSS